MKIDIGYSSVPKIADNNSTMLFLALASLSLSIVGVYLVYKTTSLTNETKISL